MPRFRIDVADVGAQIHRRLKTLKHRSVCVEFESKTEVKDRKKYWFLLFSVFLHVRDAEGDTREKANSSTGVGKWVNQLVLAGLPAFKKPKLVMFMCSGAKSPSCAQSAPLMNQNNDNHMMASGHFSSPNALCFQLHQQ